MTGGRTPVSADDVRRAAQVIAGVVRETPVLSSRTLSERAGGTVALKSENLQRTGSFKIRGAFTKVSALGDACAAGVITGSAGNHAQAVAYAARARGVPCFVFMPEGAPIAKVEAARSLGAQVSMVGQTVDEALEAAYDRAAEDERIAFVHPFEDPDVIAGQGSIGLELLEQVPDLARVIVPVGGGGLVSGVAIALKSARETIEVIGVQAASCSPVRGSLAAGKPVPVRSALTIADGIAVKRPGELTLSLIDRWVDEVVAVEEDEVAEAMVFLLERAKLVVEGAGAVGVAALLSGRVPRPRRRGRPWSSSRAATSTPGCSPRWRAGTRARPVGGSCCSPRCPTGRDHWPGCSRSSASSARTCSTSSTSARGSTCTCARPRCSSCSRRGGWLTPSA